MSSTKHCVGCNVTKPVTEYYGYKLTGNTRKLCRACCTKQRREQRARTRAARAQGQATFGRAVHTAAHVEESIREAEDIVQSSVRLAPRATVIVLGDIHFPWHHEGALELAHTLIKDTRPDYVVQMGDLYDLYSFSRYPRSLNVTTPEAELLHARGLAEEMWKRVKRDSPSARCIQLWGNHDSRAQRRTLEKLPEAEGFIARGMRDMMTFDGVTTMDNESTELIIDGVHYLHGYGSKVGDMVTNLRFPCVTAHLHVGGVVFVGYQDAIQWELGCGWLGNRRAPCFSYASRKRSHRTTLGVGLIDPYGPRFIAFDGQ